MMENKKSKKWKELSVWISIELLRMFQKIVCDFFKDLKATDCLREKNQNSFFKIYVK